MKRVIIVQARMGSTRLPGKVLLEVEGRPMLAQQLRRLRACRLADEVIVATTTSPADQPIIELAETEGVRWFRGSEHDVLSRYVEAAREAQAEVIVRVTADCPLIDPEETGRVIETLVSDGGRCDYASNIVKRTFPRGLDAEALFRDTLERVHRLGRSDSAREHVTSFILRERPELFAVASVTDRDNNADLRWTVDMPEDLELIRRIYRALGLGERLVGYREILRYIRANPELAAINAAVVQRAL